MRDKGIPFVLAVDDRPDQIRNEVLIGLSDRAQSDVVHPNDVELDQLARADVVLVDFRLEDWLERDAAALAMQPSTGLALAVLLREHVDASTKDRITAFALHSGHLGEVRGRLPFGSAGHVIARMNNLEWAFSKEDPKRWDRVVQLATAVRGLPRTWTKSDPDGSETEASALLGLHEEAQWFERAWRSVRTCQPPLHDLNDGAHGGLFLRWLLHQILPYPTFLIGIEWVAARLRVTEASLSRALSEGGELAGRMQAVGYSGILSGFLGPRWWRAGLENFLWELTSGRSSAVSDLHEALRPLCSVPLEPTAADASIVCLGVDFAPTGAVLSPSAAVRLRPDHWPSFADGAWASLSDAKTNAFLGSIVDPLDTPRLDAPTPAVSP